MTLRTVNKTIYKGGMKTPKFHSEKLKAAYDRVTTRLAQEAEHYFGERGFPVFSIVRIFRRPFTDIIQCVVQLNNINFGIYLKFSFVKKNVEGEHERILKNATREVEVTKKFSEFFSNEQDVAVPEVIAFFPDEMAIVTKEKNGIPLMSLLVQSGKWQPGTEKLDLLKNACYSVGTALNVFQKMPIINIGNDELPSNIISYVDLRLRILLETDFINREVRLNVLTFLENQLERNEGSVLNFCGVHGDLSLGNVLISSGQVVFLDLGMYRQGPSSFDPSYFYQHLEAFLTSPFFLNSTIVPLQEAFFEGYQKDFPRKDPLFSSYYVLNMVNHLLALSRTSDLSLLKKIYQKRQYRLYLSRLKKVIQES